jgi:hypothetical protein
LINNESFEEGATNGIMKEGMDAKMVIEVIENDVRSA